MRASRLKGSLLEYTVRRILLNCGFMSVTPDGKYIYSRGDLTMINGKGAAHDADVLMNPPIQMPFSYPFRLNFECKCYKSKVGLVIIRNALGLRYDINEFEIVTNEIIEKRKNNRRSEMAIDDRPRYNYQVGVASVEEFSKPAFEFAANNKIPLISLRWIFPNSICDLFHDITDDYLNAFPESDLNDLHSFLKGDSGNLNGKEFIELESSIFNDVNKAIKEFENKVAVGLLESGDLLFLVAENEHSLQYLREHRDPLRAQFHFYTESRLDHWTLTLNGEIKFKFYLSKRVIKMWKKQSFSLQEAVNLKASLFSKLFIFLKDDRVPFRIVNIDEEWLNGIDLD